ncbi:Neural proliferation differentiation control-1 protein (NPDC1) family protein [Acanthocheilonema viteae]
MWWPILPVLFLYSHASFYAIENEPELLQYGNDQKIAKLMNMLTRTNRDKQQSLYDNEYSEPEGNDMYDIDIENTENAAVKGTATKLIAAQKKGQSEYVGFIEPKVSNQMKHREILKKRVDHQIVKQTNLKPTLHLGNFLTLAAATVCMLAVVVGVATGSYYFFKDRSEKSAADNCDFTYAPTGPGKSKKKKGGDEGLAYKAQLHHYQQAKQKVISDENGAVTLPDIYDSSETSEDENNFSVYECPGLAPTGDIEVQNPNFISQT